MLKKKLISVVVIVISVLLLNVCNVFALPVTVGFVDSNDVLHMFYTAQQEKSNWCWAAASKMVGDFYANAMLGTPTSAIHTQTEIVTHEFGSPINQSANVSQIADACSFAGIKIPYSLVYTTSYASSSVFSYDLFKGFVNLHKPTIACMVIFNDSTFMGGHVLVVTGYDDSDDSIYLAEPANGSYFGYVTYTAFTSGFYYNGYTGYFATRDGHNSNGVYINEDI